MRVTDLVNSILWPRLRELGFRIKPVASDRWTEGSIIERDGPNGRRKGLLMGRDKFGHSFGVTVAREMPDGTYEYFGLRDAGLTREDQKYETTAGARVVLGRIAEAVASRMIPWLTVCVAALTACGPHRPPDFAGVVKGLGRGAYGWEAMVEATAAAKWYPAGEPMLVYLGRRPRGLRAGCRVRAWFSNGLVMTSYPGQAFAEAIRIDACPRDSTQR